MNRIELDGMWMLHSEDGKTNINGIVPGSVYGDLLRNHLIPDPFDQDNEYLVRDIVKQDFIYERTFELLHPSGICELVCEGIDTLATISINHQVICQCDNMHRTWRIRIESFLQIGENHIQIRLHSPIRFMQEKYQNRTYDLYQSKDGMKGYPFLRKGHSMMGWDWGPQLPDAGIWRSIYLETNLQARLDEIEIRQSHQDDIRLHCQIEPHIYEIGDYQLEVQLEDPNNQCIWAESTPLKGHHLLDIEIEKPQLWFPVGYGNQPLYKLHFQITDSKQIVHEVTKTIGLRDLVLKREADPFGESFTFVINGIELFAKGANYIPEDNLLSRTSLIKTKQLLQYAKDAHHNMIRIWGGGHYPSDGFYDLCDQMGLLVWQDLMFACSVYDMTDQAWVDTMLEEIKDNLKRIRHHASLVLICGNNENETAIEHWNVPNKEVSKQFYQMQYETLLKPLVESLVRDVPYWLSSPSSGKELFQDSNSDHYGDMHYWGVWHNNEPITYYRHYFPRFMSEFGIQSFPHLKTVQTFAREEDTNIFSYIMEVHQKNNTANDKILNYIGKMFRYPKDFSSLLYVSQLIQAEGIRYGVEHWRRNRGQCMGAIYWQLNDCYPVASWSSIDYYHRLKALYYHSKQFFAPILLSIEESDSLAKVFVTNDTLDVIKGQLTLQWMDFHGHVSWEDTCPITVSALSAQPVYERSFEITKNEKMTHVLVAFLTLNHKETLTNQVSFAPDKHLKLHKPIIHQSIQGDLITLKSDTFAKYVEVSHPTLDLVCSENYFHLYPNRAKTIQIHSQNGRTVPLEELQVRSLVDSY